MKDDELNNRLCTMPEYSIIREIESFKESNILLKLNYHELSKLFENFKQTVMIDFSQEIAIKNINIETKRLIHNYLCSAISLVDHTRVYIKKLHTDSEIIEYQLKIRNTFADNALCVFVKDLRQYVQHFKLPEISFQKKAFNIKPHASLIVSKDELLKFSGWTKKSKQYIQTYMGPFDLRSILKDYQLIVENFYNWLESWQENIFKTEIDIVNKMKLSIRKSKLNDIQYNILRSQYKNYIDLEKDLYNTIPSEIKIISGYDRNRKLNEIYNLFEIDEAINKFLILNSLKLLLNRD